MRTEGDFWPILTSPIAAVFLVFTVIMIVISIYSELKERKNQLMLLNVIKFFNFKFYQKNKTP